ncbi:MAG TPA: BON domain-containing protein [Ideonella sp.]|nr:BON domain-containing protein [Ideonella sp.]
MQFKTAMTAPAAPDHPFGATLGLALGLLLRATAALRTVPPRAGSRPGAARRRDADATGSEARSVTGDDALRRRVLARLAQQESWDSASANVFVDDGVVIYQGLVGRDAERPQALRAAQGLPGVRAVRDDRVRAREWQGMA